MPFDPDFDETQDLPDSYAGDLYHKEVQTDPANQLDDPGQGYSENDQDELDNDVTLLPTTLPPPTPSHPNPSSQPSAAKRVAVVLSSSLLKQSDFAKLPAYEEEEEEGEEEESDVLITSDLLPRPAPKRLKTDSSTPKPMAPQQSAAAAAAPVPFPLPTVTPQPKKRGRPLGWRAGGGSYALHKNDGTPRPRGRPPKLKPLKTPGEVKKRGRPLKTKKAPLTARQIYLRSSPKYVPFLCEWAGCPAELQNLKTLRRHLLIVHGKGVESTGCKWASCTTPQSGKEEFAKHVEEKHLVPFVWHCGDGPKNQSGEMKIEKAEDEIPGYLFGANGNQVTPSVIGQGVEGEEERKARKLRLNRIHALRDGNAPEEPNHTQEELEAISEAMRAKSKNQKMFRDYKMMVCGAEGIQPRYGREWLGNMYKRPVEED
ncbi:hypothetical protein OQA88_12317 [Cercophora sp. LCS_1]